MKRILIVPAILALLFVACNGDDNNNPDSGSTDTDTDTELTCDDIDLMASPFDGIPATECWCPNSGDHTVIITEEEILEKFTDEETIEDLLKLVGEGASIPEGNFDECVIFIVARANIPADAFSTDSDGAVVDADNLSNKCLTAGLTEFRAYDLYGNEIQPNGDITLIFPDKFGSVYRWMAEDADPHLEKLGASVVAAYGTTYLTDHLSAFGTFNRPFDEFIVDFVPGDTNGYDVNGDGVLVEIALSDEEQSQFPEWVEFEVSDGTDSYVLTPDGEPGQYRLPLFDGEHDLTFSVQDNNAEEAYRHTASEDKSINLACDTGYVLNPLDTSECIDDPCDPDPCNGHATSCDVNGPSDFTCNCDTSYDGAVCDTCAVGYENYPACTADTTPPADPEITTCEGSTTLTCPDPPTGWDPSQADITINGTCDGSDTAMIQYRFQKGADPWTTWTDITYTAGSDNWSWSGILPESDVVYVFEFRALDFIPIGNPSGSDSVIIDPLF